MTIQPRTEDEIYEDIREELASRTDKLTNFSEGSFNDQFLRAYARQIRQLELKALAAELSGYIDFAGREFQPGDLGVLGIDGVSVDEINEYTREEQLDILAANLGVTRDSGERAHGEVTFEVSDDAVSVPQGYTVATDPNSGIGGREFLVDPNGDGDVSFDNTVTATPDDGASTLTVDVVAEDVGSEYNLGPNSITHLPNPKPGIQSVTNTTSTSGGVDQQTTGSLRSDAKDALFSSSPGGTRSGIISSIESELGEDVASVLLNEFTDEQPPYVDVIVDGGDDETIIDVINSSKPWGIEYNLVRPTVHNIGVHVDIVGEDIDESLIIESVATHFSEFSISDPFFRTALINTISTASGNIDSVPALNTYHSGLQGEEYVYEDGVSTYELEFGPLGRVRDETHYVRDNNVYYTAFEDIDSDTVGVEVIEDDVGIELSDSEFSVLDSDGDGVYDTVELDSSVKPDGGTVVTLGYDHDDYTFESLETETTEFIQGEDFELIDSSGDGLMNAIEFIGETPDDGEQFTMTYQPNRSFTGDLVVGDRSKLDSEGGIISVQTRQR